MKDMNILKKLKPFKNVKMVVPEPPKEGGVVRVESNVYDKVPKGRVTNPSVVKGQPKELNHMKVQDANTNGFKTAGAIEREQNKYDIRYEIPEDYGAIEGVVPQRRAINRGGKGGRIGPATVDLGSSSRGSAEARVSDAEMDAMYESFDAASGTGSAGASSLKKGQRYFPDESHYGVGAPENVPHKFQREHVNHTYGNWNSYAKEVTALALHHGYDESQIVRKAGNNNIQKIESFLNKKRISLPTEFKAKKA